ncbi:hypothetical protein BJ085DRAFT_27290 [Dimargaris cristalligena]|uniref:Uncharacterized protein n=1 Tax=Dimargaris cristalligena TaxID=215637 RepID=A0A4Q0A1V0_9FUNG|nr:hypothetical protein BJ085DRAFT_27290 [Dimargaris cristalligena]|eukprot:RKP40065.1 hypothetical protein BJ085DRAFT_27290 [Dimargaris cristalligena]
MVGKGFAHEPIPASNKFLGPTPEWLLAHCSWVGLHFTKGPAHKAAPNENHTHRQGEQESKRTVGLGPGLRWVIRDDDTAIDEDATDRLHCCSLRLCRRRVMKAGQPWHYMLYHGDCSVECEWYSQSFRMNTLSLVALGLTLGHNLQFGVAAPPPSTFGLTGPDGPLNQAQEGATLATPSPSGLLPQTDWGVQVETPTVPVNSLDDRSGEFVGQSIHGVGSGHPPLGINGFAAIPGAEQPERGLETAYDSIQRDFELVQQYHKTIIGLSKRKGKATNDDEDISVPEMRDVLRSWSRFIRPWLASRIRSVTIPKCQRFQKEYKKASSLGWAANLGDTDPAYHALTYTQGLPLFQQEGWRFINPAELSIDTLQKNLPLLALIDAQKDGNDAWRVLATLLDRSIWELGVTFTKEREYELKNPENITENEATNFDQLDRVLKAWLNFLPDYELGSALMPFGEELYLNLAGAIMARLTATGRLGHLVQFMLQLRKARSNPRRRFDMGKHASEEQLAVVLATLVGNAELLMKLPNPIPQAYAYLDESKHEHKCIVAKFMRDNQLHRGAEFILQNLPCGSEDITELLESEDTSTNNFLNGYFKNLHLREIDDTYQGEEKFHMGAAILMSKGDVGSHDELVDMGPGPLATDHWTFDDYVTDPNFYEYLQSNANNKNWGQLDLLDRLDY